MFETSDFYLTIAMMTMGHSLHSIDRGNLKRMNFYFEITEELKIDVDMYWDRELQLDPVSLFENLNFLKRRMYGTQDS